MSGSNISVKFVSASSNAVSNQRKIIETCLNLCNSEEVPLQVCAYYCSAIAAFIPGLKGMAIDTLKSFGVQVVHINETVLGYRPRFQSEDEEGLVLVQVGLAILVLFNDVLRKSYDKLMRNWTVSLLGKIACFVEHILVDEEYESAPMINIEKAAIIRRMLGGMHGLKANILAALLANRDASQAMGRACSYLAESLAWTDMSVPIIIGDQLIRNGSPVLTDPMVHDELRHLHSAFTKINQSSLPQYYGILYPSSSSIIMDESLFPYMVAICRELMKDCRPGPAEFINPAWKEDKAPQSEGTRLADELIEIYRRWTEIESVPTVGLGNGTIVGELVASAQSVTTIYTNHDVNFAQIDDLVALHFREMKCRGNSGKRPL